jgi:putative transcriptional regulator
LEDPNFHRTVILLIEHGEEGSLGFVLTHDMSLSVQDIFEDFECDEKVYLGGPVAKNTFHYLHTISHLEGAKEILPGLFWGGDFEMLQFYFREGMLKDEKVKYFAGYSGWGDGQLEGEIEMKSWIVAPGKSEYVFNHDELLWKHILQALGGEYKWLSNAPDDVQLN